MWKLFPLCLLRVECCPMILQCLCHQKYASGNFYRWCLCWITPLQYLWEAFLAFKGSKFPVHLAQKDGALPNSCTSIYLCDKCSAPLFSILPRPRFKPHHQLWSDNAELSGISHWFDNDGTLASSHVRVTITVPNISILSQVNASDDILSRSTNLQIWATAGHLISLL